MKKTLLLLSMLLPVVLCAQLKYKVTGHLKQLNPDRIVYLSYGEMGNVVKDSVRTKNGKFQFQGSLPEVTAATISMKQSVSAEGVRTKLDMQTIYLENEETTITGDDSLRTAIIANSPSSTAYHQFRRATAGLSHDQYKAYTIDYVKQNPGSPVNFGFIEALLLPVPEDYNLLKSLFDVLDNKLQTSPKGEKLLASIHNLKPIALGAQAPEFTQFDTEDRAMQLSQMRGKYVLIDFWASWCKPCRAENPHLVKAYNLFKEKNFTILGVSIDRSKSAWLKAVEEDQLDWLQVTGEQDKGNEAADIYQIQAIPQNFLIDPTGKIIAKNLRGEELAEYLEKLL